MKENVFRKKSMERVSSPEQLNEYIRVANPGVWMVLAAIVILLIGAVIWGVVGHIDTNMTAVSVVENGKMTVYVKEADIAKIKPGQKVQLEGNEGTVAEIGAEPVLVDAQFTDYMCHVGDLHSGEWVYAVVVDGQWSDGVNRARITIESISPMSFILN